MTPNQAPATLLESLGKLRDSEHLGVLIASEQRVLDANDAYLRMIGCTRDELDNGVIDWQAITPPDHLVRDQRALEELRLFGACVPFEKEYMRKDGTRVPVLIGAVRFRRGHAGAEGGCLCRGTQPRIAGKDAARELPGTRNQQPVSHRGASDVL